jgi:hypothetical protein
MATAEPLGGPRGLVAAPGSGQEAPVILAPRFKEQETESVPSVGGALFYYLVRRRPALLPSSLLLHAEGLAAAKREPAC